MRNLRSPIIVVEDEEEPVVVANDDENAVQAAPAPTPTPAGDNAEISIENPSPEDSGGIGSAPAKQESVKHELATRLYKAIETAYGSVYELTEVLNEIGRGYKAPALKGVGNASLNLQSEIEGMPGLLDGKHEKEDVIRFMGLMDEITNG